MKWCKSINSPNQPAENRTLLSRRYFREHGSVYNSLSMNQVVMAGLGMKKGPGHPHAADVDLDCIVGYHTDEESAGELTLGACYQRF